MAVSLGLVNAPNARDLGGLATADGRTVRTGVLYRSNALHRLTPEDLVVLDGLRLACLVDFRSTDEIDATGVDLLPATPPGRVVSLPVSDRENAFFAAVTAFSAARHDKAPLAVTLDADSAVAAMLDVYRWFVTSPIARDAFGSAMRLIASAETLPLMFHCTAGKDRTGWLAAIVLSALGVDRSLIVEDYLRTNELNATTNAYMLARLADRNIDPAVTLALMEARGEYVAAAFAEVDRSFGSMDRYLRDGLSLPAAARAAISTNLLAS